MSAILSVVSPTTSTLITTSVTSGIAALAIVMNTVVNRMTLNHQQRQAQAEREWQARKDLYVQLLTHVHERGTAARGTAAANVRPTGDRAESRALWARVQLLASTEVRAAFAHWLQEMAVFAQAARSAQDHGFWGPNDAVRLSASVLRIIHAVRKEFHGESVTVDNDLELVLGDEGRDDQELIYWLHADEGVADAERMGDDTR